MSENIDNLLVDIEKKLYTMFEMQEVCNNHASGLNWKLGKTESGEPINWETATRVELTEAITECIQFKWWKAISGHHVGEILDKENLKIELVDTWHFAMSEIIRLDKVEEAVNTIVNYHKNMSGIELLGSLEVGQLVLSKVEELIKFSFYDEDNQTGLDSKKFIEGFFSTVEYIFDSFHEFYEIYFLKNILNIFRQQNGYSENKYIKIWDGKEDNVYLDEYVKANKPLDYDKIMEYLEYNYNTLTAKEESVEETYVEFDIKDINEELLSKIKSDKKLEDVSESIELTVEEANKYGLLSKVNE